MGNIPANVDMHVLRADPVFMELDRQAALLLRQLDDVVTQVNTKYPLPADRAWTIMGDYHLYPRYCPQDIEE